MSPRAFQTIIVASMGSKDRLELESKVLAASLKQSIERGDTAGVSLAHRQIILILKAQQADSAAAKGATAEAAQSQTESEAKSEPVAESAPEPAEEAKEEEDEEEEPFDDSSGMVRKNRVMPNIVWTTDEEPEDASAVPPSVSETPRSAHPPTMDLPGFKATNLQPQQHDEPEKPNFDAYGILSVEQIASFEEIHRSFLRLVRRNLFALKKAKRKQRRPILEELQNLWIAHDILTDPVTRTDFDFRILGLRGAPDVIIHTAPEDDQESVISTRTPLRIGELMECAGLLERTELEIAADMHKAMPEMLFGAFLVKQGFISDEDLGQVLMGQRLLKNGSMTVGHYQMCMKRWREEQTPIEETAVKEGLVTHQEMERILASGLHDTSGVPMYQGSSPTLRGGAPRINAEEAAKRNLSFGHAVPVWKDQLDWSEPEVAKAPEESFELERRPMTESALDIEGITDGVSKDATKKSLRRLMEGIHSQDSAQDESRNPLKSMLQNTQEVPTISEDQVDDLGPAVDFDVESRDSEPEVHTEPTSEVSGSTEVVADMVPDEPAESETEKESAKETIEIKKTSSSEQDAIDKAFAQLGTIPGAEDLESVFGELDYDDEDEAVGDYDLGFAVEGEEQMEIALEGDGDDETAESPAATSEVLLDFSATSSENAQGDDLRKVLDEAFYGIKVVELPSKASSRPTEDISIEAYKDTEGRNEEEFEPMESEDHSDIVSGVFPAFVVEAVPEPVRRDPEDEATIELEAALNADLESALALHEAEMTAAEDEPQTEKEDEPPPPVTISDVTDRYRPTASMDIPTMTAEALREQEPAFADDDDETSDEIPPVIREIGGEHVSDEVASEEEEAEEEAESNEESEPQTDSATAAEDVQEETTDEIEAVKRQAVDDDQSSQPARLKSGEWQIVYKLEGTLADVFLGADEPEPELKLRPRLTEIDTIIPGSITKIAKEEEAKKSQSDEQEAEEDSDTADASDSDEKPSSDKPIIKPVSNSYYKGNEKGTKGGDKGKGGKSDKSGDKGKGKGS